MSVEIVWTNSSAGDDLEQPVDHGSNATGQVASAQRVYIRHTGDNNITDCKFFFRAFQGTTGDGDAYAGDQDPSTDFAELVEWGDGTTEATFGGIQINMNQSGVFPATDWPDINNRIASGGRGFVVSTSVADTEATGFPLLEEMGLSASGVIPAGVSPGVSFQTRVIFPSGEQTAGTRQVEQVLSFTFTE